MGLTKQEKENLVLDLYYNEGKTHSEIAKEARISLRDVGPIIKKSGSEQSLSNSSQAYLYLFCWTECVIDSNKFCKISLIIIVTSSNN